MASGTKSMASDTKRRILPWAATEGAAEPPAPGMQVTGQKAGPRPAACDATVTRTRL
jgi:hypothetical protein